MSFSTNILLLKLLAIVTICSSTAMSAPEPYTWTNLNKLPFDVLNKTSLSSSLIPQLSRSNSDNSFFQRATSYIPKRISRAFNSFNEKYNINDIWQTFKNFTTEYHKTYNATELPIRFQNFIKRLRLVEQSLRDFASNKTSFVMGPNNYLDWSDDELKVLTSLQVPTDLSNHKQDMNIQFFNPYSFSSSGSNSMARVPAEKDWRTSGCMGSAQQQGECGACYAFATLGVVESMMCLKTGTSAVLSRQELVDCSLSYSNKGCNGGWPTRVFSYLKDKRSVARESCYPYREEASWRCKRPSVSNCMVNMKKDLSVKQIKGHNNIMASLGTIGPLVGLIEANDNFIYYKRGIFTDRRCSKRDSAVNHGIILAGYGEENGNKYWLIKNSWGQAWGDNGYGKVKRGVNECSIESLAWVVHDA